MRNALRILLGLAIAMIVYQGLYGIASTFLHLDTNSKTFVIAFALGMVYAWFPIYPVVSQLVPLSRKEIDELINGSKSDEENEEENK